MSLIVHPRNPYAPTSHANIRFFIAHPPAGAGDADEEGWWFGGGFDLTPYYGFEEDAIHWHRTAAEACAPFGDDRYDRYKTACDDYFYLPHRQEMRGVGGLFFDDLNQLERPAELDPFGRCFAFARSIGDHFLPAYLPILERRKDRPVRRTRAPFPALSAGALRGVQPGVRPRHPLRTAGEGTHRVDPRVAAAARGLALRLRTRARLPGGPSRLGLPGPSRLDLTRSSKMTGTSLYEPEPHLPSDADRRAIGVLLANVGTPAAPTAKALRRYLRQFLTDTRIAEAPRWKWLPILYLFVLTTRPQRVAKLYQKIWTDEGSPLLAIGNCQVEGIAARLRQSRRDGEPPFHVALGMRYGEPSIRNALAELRGQGMHAPSVPSRCSRSIRRPPPPPRSTCWHGNFAAGAGCPNCARSTATTTIQASCASLAASIRETWADGEPDRLVLSYHGVPQRYIDNGDPYQCQCLETTRLLVEELGIDEERVLSTFQSQFGRELWIRPKTDALPCASCPKPGSRTSTSPAPASPPTASRPSKRSKSRTAATSRSPAARDSATSPASTIGPTTSTPWPT